MFRMSTIKKERSVGIISFNMTQSLNLLPYCCWVSKGYISVTFYEALYEGNLLFFESGSWWTLRLQSTLVISSLMSCMRTTKVRPAPAATCATNRVLLKHVKSKSNIWTLPCLNVHLIGIHLLTLISCWHLKLIITNEQAITLHYLRFGGVKGGVPLSRRICMISMRVTKVSHLCLLNRYQRKRWQESQVRPFINTSPNAHE